MGKVTISLDDEMWHQFRIACLVRKISASSVIGEMIRARLEEWKLAETQEREGGNENRV